MKKVFLSVVLAFISANSFALGTEPTPCNRLHKGDRHVASKAVVHSTASKEAKGVK